MGGLPSLFLAVAVTKDTVVDLCTIGQSDHVAQYAGGHFLPEEKPAQYFRPVLVELKNGDSYSGTLAGS